MHSTGARHRIQDPEQDCEMGQPPPPPFGSRCGRIKYEAVPRHAELIIQTWTELFISECDHAEGSRNLDLAPAECSTMWITLCYLALDRPDLQFPSKELARWMQAPTVGHLEALKRVARYLIGHGRVIQEFVR